MTWDHIEGSWHQLRGKARERWGELFGHDADVAEGCREQLAGRIKERYAIEKSCARRRKKSWMKEPGALDDWNDTRSILDM